MNDVLITSIRTHVFSRAVLSFAFCSGYALPQPAGHREQVGTGQRRCAGGAQARCGGDCGEDLRLRVALWHPHKFAGVGELWRELESWSNLD